MDCQKEVNLLVLGIVYRTYFLAKKFSRKNSVHVRRYGKVALLIWSPISDELARIDQLLLRYVHEMLCLNLHVLSWKINRYKYRG